MIIDLRHYRPSTEMPKEKLEPEKPKKDAPEKASWSEDQKNHGYYYDDAHGYEVYRPEGEEKETCD